MRRPSTLASVGLGAALAVLTMADEARADMSSWYSVQGGYAKLRWTEPPVFERSRYTMPIDTGLGAPPSWAVIPGVGARLTPYFGQGTDWSLYARVMNRGYLTGGFGAALDGGAYVRAFGAGSSGYMGTLTLGLPWGIIASGTYATGSHDATTTSVGIGIDFARLTVYRLSLEQQWPNVRPAWRPGDP